MTTPGPWKRDLPSRVKPTVTITPVFKTGLRAVTILLGDGTAKAVADGGWSFVSRPKNVGFTTWDGQSPYTMTIPVMFDAFIRQASVEADLEALRQIMRRPVGPAKQPSPVRLAGPLPLTNLLWVVQAVPTDAEIRRSVDGARVRASAEITLMEYVEADVLVSARPSPAKAATARQAASPKSGAKPSSRTYTVKSGDTLSKIAAKMLGSYKRYTEIAKLNGIRDPNKIRVGQVLRLP